MVNLTGGLASKNKESVQAVCLVLSEAVSHRLILGDNVVKTLISSCASVAHWPLCVNTVSDILSKMVAYSVQQTGSFKNPYSLRYSYTVIVGKYHAHSITLFQCFNYLYIHILHLYAALY